MISNQNIFNGDTNVVDTFSTLHLFHMSTNIPYIAMPRPQRTQCTGPTHAPGAGDIFQILRPEMALCDTKWYQLITKGLHKIVCALIG